MPEESCGPPEIAAGNKNEPATKIARTQSFASIVNELCNPPIFSEREVKCKRGVVWASRSAPPDVGRSFGFLTWRITRRRVGASGLARRAVFFDSSGKWNGKDYLEELRRGAGRHRRGSRSHARHRRDSAPCRRVPPWGQPTSDNPLLVATAYRIVYGAVGGYIAARLAPNRPMAHALAGGVVALIVSVAGTAATWNRGAEFGPHWYPLALIVIAMPCAWAGGKFREMQLR